MTTYADTVNVTRQYDRRVKYTEEDKQEMRDLAQAGYSEREISRRIPCSRRLVSFVLHPEKLIANRKVHTSKKYTKEEWRNLMAEHRRYKKALMTAWAKLEPSHHKTWKRGTRPDKDPHYKAIMDWLRKRADYAELQKQWGDMYWKIHVSKLNRKELDEIAKTLSYNTTLCS